MDYNIYIHNLNDGAGKKTQPWNKESKERKTTPKYKKAISIVNKIGNPDGVINSAIGKAVKAIPAVAVAAAVLGLGDKIISTTASFVTAESGDYRFVTTYNNFKTALHACIRPVSTTINTFKAFQQYRIEDTKRSLRAGLLGDSVINSYMNYGV